MGGLSFVLQFFIQSLTRFWQCNALLVSQAAAMVRDEKFPKLSVRPPVVQPTNMMKVIIVRMAFAFQRQGT
jgi:hypothetical protein